MFKKILAFFAAMAVFAAFAAVDANKATEAELDSIKKIGPATSKLIIAERKKGDFKSWDDFISRVKGVGEKNAAIFSADGLTIGGASYTGAPAKAPAAAAAKKDEKPAAPAAKAEAAKPAASAAKAEAAKPAAPAVAAAPAATKAEAAKPAAPAASAAKPAASAAKK